MTIGERLGQELDGKGMSAPLTAELTGQKNREVISWLADEGEPYAQALSRLADAGVDILFVLTGRSGPRNQTEFALIHDYRICDQAGQEKIIKAIAEAVADTKKDEIKLDLTSAGQ